MSSQHEDDREEAEYPDFLVETYEANEDSTVFYDPENPISWLESDYIVDLGDML